ncbi:MAG TPA: hypothetical protein VH186_35680 [Chloroflexia bacterium]|nr:hypothetical protein [Chloroflexia bacterium]
MKEQPANPRILIEREREIIFLEGVLAARASGKTDVPRTVFVCAPAGRGSSTLLDVTGQIARDQFGYQVFSGKWVAGAGSLEGLRDSLPASFLESYQDQKLQLAELEKRVEIAQLSLGLPVLNPPSTEERYRAVQAIPQQALHYLIRRIYTTYDPARLSEQAAAFLKTGLEHLITLNANNLAQLRAFVEELQSSFSPEEWELYLRPEETMAKAFGRKLAAQATQKPLLVTLDDYQLPEATSERAIRMAIEESGQTLWLINTKNPPAWDIFKVATLNLEPLSTQGVINFMSQAYGSAITPGEAEHLFEISGGEPLTLRLAGSLYKASIPLETLADVSLTAKDDRLQALLVFLSEESNLINQSERLALYRAALLHEPSPEFKALYAQACQEAGYPFDESIINELFSRYPWLLETTTGNLHPAVKSRLRTYLTVEKRRFSQPVQEAIIEPARSVAVTRLAEREKVLVQDETIKGSLAGRARDAEWGKLVGQVAYYRFWLDEAVGWFFLLPRWLIALAYNESLAHDLLALAEGMNKTFYVEGQEILPYLRVLLTPGYSGGRARLEEKLAALEGLEELGTSGRGRWYRAENLGVSPRSGGSPEAELRGLLKWFQARLLEEAGQYERTASLYESVLATNVAMPDMEKAASRAALYLATRYRLKGADESAYSALNRAVELDPGQPIAQQALYYQAIRTGYFSTALKAADTLSALSGYEAEGELLTIFALYALNRETEAQTELRSYLARPAEQLAGSRIKFKTLSGVARLPGDNSDPAIFLNQLG